MNFTVYNLYLNKAIKKKKPAYISVIIDMKYHKYVLVLFSSFTRKERMVANNRIISWSWEDTVRSSQYEQSWQYTEMSGKKPWYLTIDKY